jgi:hypothetical protein
MSFRGLILVMVFLLFIHIYFVVFLCHIGTFIFCPGGFITFNKMFYNILTFVIHIST